MKKTAARAISNFINKNKNISGSKKSAFLNTYQKSIFEGNIRVVSYNIKYSRKIDKAIKLLLEHKDLDDAEILCLQEMTYAGVKKIATTLCYNYIYYPAAVHRIGRVNMGNAILSKWPIEKHRKLVLPHIDKSKSRRIAVQAIINVENRKLMVFSVHKEVLLKPVHRAIQIKQIIHSIPHDIKHCIVAGDFNTFTNKHLKAILEAFEEEKFKIATGDVKWSYKHWYLLNKKSRLDHIFSRGLNIISSGHVVNRKASDHLPIWADFSFQTQ